MSSRSTPPFPAPFSWSFSIADCTEALSLRCGAACEAIAEDRFLAAHHLFQGAPGYFDRVQQLATRSAGKPPTFADNAKDVLLAARAELDNCAQHVYFDALHGAVASKPGGDLR